MCVSQGGSNSAGLMVRIDQSGNIYVTSHGTVDYYGWFYGTGTVVL